MAGVNKVILLGRLGNDPDLKHTQNGTAVCKFSLATSDVWFDDGGNKREETEWHKITVWAKTGENCAKYLKKGRQVYIEGKLKTNTYEKDGKKQFFTEIVAENVQFLGDGQSTQQQGQPPAQTSQQYNGQRQQNANRQQTPQGQGHAGPYANSGGGLEDIPF